MALWMSTPRGEVDEDGVVIGDEVADGAARDIVVHRARHHILALQRVFMNENGVLDMVISHI